MVQVGLLVHQDGINIPSLFQPELISKRNLRPITPFHTHTHMLDCEAHGGSSQLSEEAIAPSHLLFACIQSGQRKREPVSRGPPFRVRN